MKRSLLSVLTVLAMANGVPAVADDTRIGVTPDEVEWRQVEGLGLAIILQGDPTKSGPYVLRMKVPPNNITQPHVHQQAENITVISGSFGFGLGTVFDRSKGRLLPAGSFVHLPANTPHFAWSGADGAVIQANGDGPFP